MFYFYYADIDNIYFITFSRQFQEYHQNVKKFGSWSDQARFVGPDLDETLCKVYKETAQAGGPNMCS